MLKKTIVAAMMIALFAASGASAAALMKDPAEIIKKSKEKVMSYSSYSFTVEKSGWDFNLDKTANATKNLSGEAGSSSVASRFTGDVKNVDTKSKIMHYISAIKFMKPYALKMKIVTSDYVPAILQEGVLTYNASKDKNKFYVKTHMKLIPAVPRSMDTESGNFTYSCYHISYMSMENYMKVIKPKLDGIEKVQGRPAYKITFYFNKDLRPKVFKVDFNAWGVPEEIHKKYMDKMKEVANDKRVGKYSYWIDAETLNLVKEQVMQLNGQEYWHIEWKDIKVNNLSPKDF